jgi:hypothetical protein
MQLQCYDEIGGGGGGGIDTGGDSGGGGVGGDTGFDPFCIDCGGDEIPEISEKLKAILDQNSFQTNITNGNGVWEKIDEALNDGLDESPIRKKMYDKLVQKGFKCNFDLMNTNGSKFGNYTYNYNNNPGRHGIQLDVSLFGDFKDWLKVTLFAELTHAWMAVYYDGMNGRSDYDAVLSTNPINIECEQRFFIEYVKFLSISEGENMFGLKDGYTFYGDKPLNAQLDTWLKEIKNSMAGKPTSANMQAKYSSQFIDTWFRNYWKDYPNKYTQKPTYTSLLPSAILSLFE